MSDVSNSWGSLVWQVRCMGSTPAATVTSSLPSMANRNLRQVRIEKSSRNGDSYEDMGPRPQQQLLHPGKNSNKKRRKKRPLDLSEGDPSLMPPNKRPLDLSEGDPSLMPPKMEDCEEEEKEKEEKDKDKKEKAVTIDIKSLLKPGEKRYNQRCRLFVGNLPTDITKEDFKKIFEKYGETKEVYINRDHGFGFIRLESRTLAEIANAELDGMILKGRPLRIRFATRGGALIVRNLSPVVSNELLGEAFSIFGPVERALVTVDDCGKTTGKGFVEFVGKHPAQKALSRCAKGLFILTTTPQPVVVEPMDLFDKEEGLPEKSMNKTSHYLKERKGLPRFAQPGTFEFEYSSRWKAVFEMEKQQREQVDRNINEAKEKLETEMEAARNAYQLMLMRQDLMRRQEELRKLEDLGNQELQERKQYHMRNEEEVRRREEEFVRQHDPEEIRQEVFKSGYMDSREQDMRMGDMGVHGSINMEDTYSPAPAVSQGPPSMMGMNMNNRSTIPGPAMGTGTTMATEGNASLGQAMMPDDGTMRNDRFAQGSPSQMGSPMVNRSGTEAAQPTMVGSAGPGGYGRGNQGGYFDATNERRCYESIIPYCAEYIQ